MTIQSIRITGVMVRFEPRSKTITLGFVASPLSTQHYGIRLGIRIMCPNGATCLSTESCFSMLALYKSNSACWSGTKRTSSSSHWTVTCFHHYLAELVLSNNHSLTIQRNWQHWVHKTQDADKQKNIEKSIHTHNVLDTTMRKQTQIT